VGTTAGLKSEANSEDRRHPAAGLGVGNDPRPARDLKLSFARLAAAQAAKNRPGPRTAASAARSAGSAAVHRKGLHTRACDYLAQVFQALRSRQGFSLEEGIDIVRQMAADDPVPDALFIAALHLDDRRRFAVHHSVNVAVYAVKMAKDLGYEPERQVQIGLAGLLHDVGMALIPENIIYKQTPLNEAETKLLRERPNTACRILQETGPTYAFLAECAGQVYERMDGSGYPRGLRGDEIHEYARIIGLLDIYEALVHSRPDRDKLSFFEAAKYIFKSCKTQFERRHMKSLLRVFTVFPVQSFVQLNSEAIGRVLATYPDQPMRPQLQILLDSQRRKVLTERIVSLPEAPLLNIVRCVSEKEIKDLLHGTPSAPSASEENCDTVGEPIM
jgi:hypothetical protein